MKTIGVIGGGQLALMMAQEAKHLDVNLWVQTAHGDDPAVKLAQGNILGAVNDVEATKHLSDRVDLITFENEFVDLDGLKSLELQGTKFYPPIDSLAPLLDKYDQRQLLQSLNLPVPVFSLLSERPDPTFPCVLKARTHGYDGQGTFIVNSKEQLAPILAKFDLTELLVEEFIPFERELAIVVARNHQGKVATYPVVETQQIDQVCRVVIAPAPIPSQLQDQIQAMITQVVNHLNFVGVMAMELFLTKDGRILINELAPRTHNSGHYTLDGAETSQFALQLQAIAGLPLGSTDLKSPQVLMVNLLGFSDDLDEHCRRLNMLELQPRNHIHWYGKPSTRRGRKVGHVSVLAEAGEDLNAIAQEIERIWYNS